VATIRHDKGSDIPANASDSGMTIHMRRSLPAKESSGFMGVWIPCFHIFCLSASILMYFGGLGKLDDVSKDLKTPARNDGMSRSDTSGVLLPDRYQGNTHGQMNSCCRVPSS